MYTTRFAPSPTGPLHLGHAYSARLAYDKTRANSGQFLLRMEDTDLARSKSQWDDLIQEDLRWLGLEWDGAIHRQSKHIPAYNAQLEHLIALDLLYPCSCSRKDIRAALSAPQEGVMHDVYPGTCRGRDMQSRQPGDALRLNLSKALDTLPPLVFTEIGPKFAGTHTIDPDIALRDIGDVVLSRKGEDIVAYFLASALDDVTQEITHVVRGEDLFDFTAIQVILLALFDQGCPIYDHHRLIRDTDGKRLAKRDDARAIATFRAEGLTPADIWDMLSLPVLPKHQENSAGR